MSHSHRMKRETCAVISRQRKIFTKVIDMREEQIYVITSQNASYIDQTHCIRRKCKNHRNVSTLQIVKGSVYTQPGLALCIDVSYRTAQG